MRINFAFATNYNLETDILPNDRETELEQRIYSPFIDALEELDMKSNHFFTGWTLEQLLERSPHLIKRIKKLVSQGKIEIGNHTYGHPILTLIPTTDIELQIDMSKSIEEKVFSIKSKGFYPPEWCIDPTIPEILSRKNFEWMMLLDSNVVGAYGQGFTDIFYPKKIKGVHNSEIKAVFVYGGGNELSVRNKMFKVLEGKLSAKEYVDFVVNSLKRNIREKAGMTPLYLMYMDSEAPFFVLDGDNDPSRRVYEILEEIISRDIFSSVTISEHLSENPADEYAIPKATATYKPMKIWQEGSEKLDILLNEARILLEKVISSPSIDLKENKVQKAIKTFLLAEGSDARIAVAENRLSGIPIGNKRFYGNYDRVIRAYERAVEAKRLFEEVLRKNL